MRVPDCRMCKWMRPSTEEEIARTHNYVICDKGVPHVKDRNIGCSYFIEDSPIGILAARFRELENEFYT